MLVLQTLLFSLCGYSLIKCFVLDADDTTLMHHLFELSYLFLHLIIIAIIFYLTFRAMMKGSQIFFNLMIKDRDEKNIKALIIASVLSFVFILLGVYSALLAFGAPIPLSNVLGGVVSHAIMNASLLALLLSVTAIIFALIYKKGDINDEQRINIK